MNTTVPPVFDKLLAGGMIPDDDPQLLAAWQVVARTMELSAVLNAATSKEQVRERLSEITSSAIDSSTTIFAPFYTNFGRHINIGKNVFINHACSFLDLGGITIEDNVQIGPRVNLITENHPLNPTQRKYLDLKPILIQRNAWIGEAATTLPGVTIDENAVVAAGALVTKDVAANTVIAGIPAKVIKSVE